MTFKRFDATRDQIYLIQLQAIICSIIAIQVKQQRQLIHSLKMLEMSIAFLNS